MAAIKGVILYDSYGRPMVLAGGIASETTLLALLAQERMLAPETGDSNNQAVTTAAVTTFATVAGERYLITATTEQTFLEGTDPTSTAGMILPAGVVVGPIESRAGGTFRLRATTSNGRASVERVSP